MEKEKHLPMLRAVQEVKAQHYIGSVDAYQYLRDRRRWDDLLAIVREIKSDEASSIDEEETRKLLRGLIDFREEIVLSLNRCLNVSQEDAGQFVGLPGEYYRPSEDYFGKEGDFIKYYFESGVSSLEQLDEVSQILAVQLLFFPIMRVTVGGGPSDETVMALIHNRIYPAFIAFIQCLEGQCEEGGGHPLFPDVQRKDELLNEILLLFGEDAMEYLYTAVNSLLCSDMESNEEWTVDNFYPPEELYRRLEREQIMHDIWLQRELIISWAERYPVNDYTERHDFDRIGSFEDASFMVKCDLDTAREKLEEAKSRLSDARARLLKYEDFNMPSVMVEHKKKMEKVYEMEVLVCERNIRAYEFIKTQLYRHRNFLQKFLQA